MKKTLLLVAGLPGTGKTYLGNLIQKEVGSFKLISPDEIKESVFDQYGFASLVEKQKLEILALDYYYEAMGCAMKHGTNIMSDYPFSQKQRPTLLKLSNHYGYQVITILLTADLNVLYQRQKKRDLDPSRHLGHIVTSYKKGDVLKDRSKADNLLSYEEFIKRCTTRGYDTFSLGHLIHLDVTDFNHVDTHFLTCELNNLICPHKTNVRFH